MSKSILDGVPVVESRSCEGKFCPAPDLGIVGNCPACGSPIYGPKTVAADGQAPVPVRLTCYCSLKNNWQQTK